MSSSEWNSFVWSGRERSLPAARIFLGEDFTGVQASLDGLHSLEVLNREDIDGPPIIVPPNWLLQRKASGVGYHAMPYANEVVQQLDTMTRVASGNKRHVQMLVRTIDAVAALADAWLRPDMSPPTQAAGRHLRAVLDSGEQPSPAADPQHAARGTNAEDCPACDTTTLPYPWICPGQPECPGCGDTGACAGGPCAHPAAQQPGERLLDVPLDDALWDAISGGQQTYVEQHQRVSAIVARTLAERAAEASPDAELSGAIARVEAVLDRSERGRWMHFRTLLALVRAAVKGEPSKTALAADSEPEQKEQP